MPPLRSAVASIWPFGLNATAVTQSVCFLDFVLKFARFGGEDFDEAAGGANCNLRLIGANVGRENGVIIIAENCHSFAGENVPQNHASGARATSAAGEQ